MLFIPERMDRLKSDIYTNCKLCGQDARAFLFAMVEDERRSMFLLTLSDLFGKSVELSD